MRANDLFFLIYYLLLEITITFSCVNRWGRILFTFKIEIKSEETSPLPAAPKA